MTETGTKEKINLKKSPEGRLTQTSLAVHPKNIMQLSDSPSLFSVGTNNSNTFQTKRLL